MPASVREESPPLREIRAVARLQNLRPGETFNDRPALVIEFATKPDQQVLRML